MFAIMSLCATITLGVKAIVNPQGPTVVKDFTNCVKEIVENDFKNPGLIIFANTNNISSSVARIRAGILQTINEKLIYTVEVKSPRNEPAICLHEDDDEDLTVIHKEQFVAVPMADYYIIVIDNYYDFAQVTSRIIRSRTWNPLAKFIILLFHFTSTGDANVDSVERILSCLFRQNVINIVVIIPLEKNIRNAIIYSWRPFAPPQYCGYFNETAKNRLTVENICENGALKTKTKVYINRIPENMTGCVLHILALERQPFISADPLDPNIERYFINQLADRYGFTTNYQILIGFRGERNETGDWDGALKELAAKQGHMLLGGIFPDFDVHEDFQPSETYLADSYTWVAPKAFPSPAWTALIVIFEDLVWYSAVAGFLICVITWKVLGHLGDESIYHKTFRHCFMNTWICMVGFCSYSRPKKQGLRVFYVFLNIYCMLFLTGYQTKLIDVLKNPPFEEQIDTIEEIVASGLKFGGFEELHDLFYNSSDPFDYLLGEEWVDVFNITQALIDVAVHRNFTVLCSRLELAHLSAVIPELSDSFGNFRYFAFETNMFSVPMEIVALRGFAFMEKFSKTLEVFKQMGVSSGVRRYFDQLNILKRSKLLRSLGNEDEIKPLSLQHLQGGFLVLIVGYISGLIVFTVEQIVNTKFVQKKIKIIKKKLRKILRNRKHE